MSNDNAFRELEEWTRRVARLGGRKGMGELSERLEEASLELIEEQHQKGIGANGVKLKDKLEQDGNPPLTRSGRMRKSWFTRRRGLDFVLENTQFYSAVHERGSTIRAKRKPYLKFVVNGRWVSKKQVRIPMRKMTPSRGKLPARWSKRYKREAERHFTNIMGRKLRSTF